MNKISLAFALLLGIALSFAGCKSTKKVGTVEAGGAKAHNDFFALMQEQDSIAVKILASLDQCGQHKGD